MTNDLTRNEALQKLSVSPGTLHQLEKSYFIIALRFADDTVLYPGYQFSENGLSVEFATLVSAFREAGVSGWYMHHFFLSPHEGLGCTPLEALAAGQLEAVRLAASLSAALASLKTREIKP